MDIDWDKVEKDSAAFGVEIYPLEECTIGDCLGGGAAMEVFKGKCKINMIFKDVAFKRYREFRKPDLKQKDVDKVLQDLWHEITLMKRLEYQANVAQVYGVTFEEKKPVLIVELGNETLSRYLLDKADSGTPATWREKIKLCGDVSRGIRCLHDAGIMHGNIKGDSVLVFIKSTGIPTAKLSDIGYSSMLTSPKGNIGGTRIFMAPECRGVEELSSWARKQTQDIFSFGLVTYQIASDGKIPYEDAEDVEDAEDAEEISMANPTNRHAEILLLGLPPSTPEVFRKIITETTRYMPTERASLDIVEQMLYDVLDTTSSQQVTVTTNISLTSSNRSSYEEAKFVFESYAVYNSAGITSANELPIPSALKPMIFSDYQRLSEDGDGLVLLMLGVCSRDGFGTEMDGLKAIEYFMKAAEAGVTAAQNNLALCYERGICVAKDIFKAVELYKKGAEAGDARAQCNLGLCYEKGEGLTKNISKAIELYTKSAQSDNAFAYYCLGRCYELGSGVVKDIMKAVELYKIAVEIGNPDAQCSLGSCYHDGKGVTKDELKAVVLYIKAAEAGNARAQTELGFCYHKGIGMLRDYSKAVEWYKKGAEGGNTTAQRNLGLCYQYGDGVTKDEFKAVELYTKAAEKGDELAQTDLGICYEKGTGIPKDYSKAVEWYKKAAEGGNAFAQHNLGRCYQYGNGVMKNEFKAVGLYTKAVEAGNEWAQNLLGFCYEKGIGVTKDYSKAIEFYTKSANALAQGNLDRLKSKIMY